MKNPIAIYLPLILIFLSASACRQPEGGSGSEGKESIFDRFNRQELVHLELQTDLEKLQAPTGDEEFQPAHLIWTDSSGQSLSFNLRARSRGVSRRNFCEFPPIKLKFSKADLKHKELASFNDLKLVTHCTEDERLVLKEFLGYKIFQQLTDKSFRVQLARVRYIDESGKTPPQEKYGFLIEDEKELAARLNGEVIDAPKELKVIDAAQYQLLTVFQYMIGNTDWALANSHNIKLLKTAAGNAPTMVPYDFDLSGMVNAPYAIPHPMLPIDSVRQRYFQWRSKNRDGLDATLAFFNERRETILQVCRDFSYLDEASRQDIIAYLDSFFQIINDPEQRNEQLFQTSER